MLCGMRTRLPCWSQPASSLTRTASAPGKTSVLISFGCSFIASVLVVGMTIAAPTPRAWQIATTRWTES